MPIGGGGLRMDADELERGTSPPRVFRRLATDGATAEVVCAGTAGGRDCGSGGAAAVGGLGAAPPGGLGTELRDVSDAELASWFAGMTLVLRHNNLN